MSLAIYGKKSCHNSWTRETTNWGHLLHNIKSTGGKNQQTCLYLTMIKNHDMMVEQWRQWCQATCGKT